MTAPACLYRTVRGRPVHHGCGCYADASHTCAAGECRECERADEATRLLGMRDGFHDLEPPAGMTPQGLTIWRESRDHGRLVRVLVDLTGGLR